ncbi:hypothetical protein E8L99_04365 [Phreatobacter aquaticus]|uniref:Uncharacterized protein n=1 Tax=Phreatobacter aquaticus TaxID=2570229 RepID=A0A4D7QI25_9HYPH|nr:hypothetical protein [Phreatobacter aquaticus]QCK85066.1 hypothetical protein E8L99_04365 [Phreatobacter aquaticus]
MSIKSRLILPTLMFTAAMLAVLATCFLSLALQPSSRFAPDERVGAAGPNTVLAINTRAATETLDFALPARADRNTDR